MTAGMASMAGASGGGGNSGLYSSDMSQLGQTFGYMNVQGGVIKGTWGLVYNHLNRILERMEVYDWQGNRLDYNTLPESQKQQIQALFARDMYPSQVRFNEAGNINITDYFGMGGGVRAYDSDGSEATYRYQAEQLTDEYKRYADALGAMQEIMSSEHGLSGELMNLQRDIQREMSLFNSYEGKATVAEEGVRKMQEKYDEILRRQSMPDVNVNIDAQGMTVEQTERLARNIIEEYIRDILGA